MCTHTQTQKHTALKGSVRLPPPALDTSWGRSLLPLKPTGFLPEEGRPPYYFLHLNVSGTFYVFSLFFEIGLQLENSTVE